MKDSIRISTVNFHAKWGDKAANLARICSLIESCALEGSQLIVFPEMALTSYDDEEDKAREEKMQVREAEPVPGPSSLAVAELTRKYGVYVAFGMPELDAEDPAKVYNSACVCGPKGIIGAYRKLHLPYPEYHWAVKGEQPMTFMTEWGPVGISICYDTYCFPELSRYYAAKGCRIHINCTAHARCHGGDLANYTLNANAGNERIYIVSSNLIGMDLTNDFWGGSSIIGPDTGAFGTCYYAGVPFKDPQGYKDGVESAVVDLGLATRTMFEPNKDLDGTPDFRVKLYREMLEDLAKDPKFA